MNNYQKIGNIPVVGVETLFGSSHTIFGDSKRPLILRTNGKIKVQWGNQFLDIFKLGELVSKDLFKSVKSQEDINLSEDGLIFIEEDESIVIIYKGKLYPLITSDGEYVSYKIAQQLSDTDRRLALSNLGLVYKNNDEIQTKLLEKPFKSLAYLEDEKDLKYIDGESVESLFLKLSGGVLIGTLTINAETALYTQGKVSIGDITINNNEIKSEKDLKISSQNNEIILFSDRTSFNKPIVIDEIKSLNYGDDTGFKLYSINNQSFLEIDHIKSRFPIQQNQIRTELIEYLIWISDYDLIKEDFDSLNFSIQGENYESTSSKYKVGSKFIIEGLVSEGGIYFSDEEAEDNFDYPLYLKIPYEVTEVTFDEDSYQIIYTVKSLNPNYQFDNFLNKKITYLLSENINSQSLIKLAFNKESIYQSSNLDLLNLVKTDADLYSINKVNTRIGDLFSLMLPNVVLNSQKLDGDKKFEQYGLFSKNAHIYGGLIQSKDKTVSINLETAEVKIPDLIDLIKQVNTLKQEVNSLKEDLDKSKKDLNKDISDLTEKLDETNEKLGDLNQKIEDLTSKLDSKETEISNLRNELSETNSNLISLENRVKALEP